METMGRRRAQAAALTCCLLLLATSSPPAAAAAAPLWLCVRDCMAKRCGAHPSPVHCFFLCDSFCDPFGYSKAAVHKNSGGAIIAAAAPQLLGGGGAPAVSAKKLKPATDGEPRRT